MRVRSLLLAATLGIGAVVISQPAYAAGPAIQITKIYYNSYGRTSDTPVTNAKLNGEYVQIKNTTKKAVSLKGWTLRDKQSTASGHIFKFGTFTLGAGKTVTVRTGKGKNTSTNRYWGRSSTQGTFAYIWNNTSDTAYLRNASGTLKDSCSYKSKSTVYSKAC
ncbi:lamin tail domain-containing protein [Planotetraspora phitsanulokensis]|uniref:LTD domain-containing protein n=1 Tax=Planotetraspora phitsanulokensis TaxID=575192 RepID=A0A8J3UAM5_9ACTN|nr:lamin tail domain-containing protein [Planotetraspora phitsanulokensis]GII41350.1 hypothetical protein Pph01_63530 [Planotetraspora phitsanulokensis]